MLAGEPAERVWTDYYDVTGDSARELRTALDRHGPLSANGRRHDARTSWRIGWTPRFFKAPGACALRLLDVTVDATVLLPRWKNRPQAATSLSERWTDYLEALTTHEAGHVEIACEAAADLRRRAAQIGPRPTCRVLATELKALGRQVLDEHRSRELRYDQETDHGRTQGARFE